MFRQSANLHASYGITTVQDGGTGIDRIEAFMAAADREPFPIDVVAFARANDLDIETLDSVPVSSEYTGGFRVGGFKFMLDGSPQGRTAFLSQPYDEGPPGAPDDYRAYPSYTAEEYNVRIAHLISTGKPVLAHANGDAAIDMMIEGVAAAVDGDEIPDHRTVIIHAQLMREDQLPLVKALGLVPSYYAVHPYFWGDWHRVSFGEERASFISPMGRTAELGIPFTIHNDSPVVPPDVMRLLWIAVNRKTRSGYVLGPDQRATPNQALHAVTLGAAYQYFEEDTKGSITPGKRADLVILDANPLTVDPDAIKDINVIETIARGNTVYRRQ
jgi:predicted amidohydrolase YtcJ